MDIIHLNILYQVIMEFKIIMVVLPEILRLNIVIGNDELNSVTNP